MGRLTVEPASEGETASSSGPDCLYEDLKHRLERGSVTMALSFAPAMPGDATDNVTAAWSEGGAPVILGLLSSDRIAADQVRQGALAFKPSRLPPGIAFARDAMIGPRFRAYRLAAERRV